MNIQRTASKQDESIVVVRAYPLKIKAIQESLLLKPVNATTADTLLKVEKILFFTDFFTKRLNYLLLMKTKFAQMEEIYERSTFNRSRY